MTTAPTCTRCGESIGPADRFCPRCGADVSGVQASIATAVVHQHAPPAPAALQAAQLDAVRQATLGEYEILGERVGVPRPSDRKSTRLNSSHTVISYAVFCLKKR